MWSDLHQDITIDANGRIKSVTEVEAVKTSIDNILRTFVGERVMLPEFASKFRGIVFERIDDDLENDIANEVKEVIETWDDRVNVTGVGIDKDVDRHLVKITVMFQIPLTDNEYSTTVTV